MRIRTTLGRFAGGWPSAAGSPAGWSCQSSGRVAGGVVARVARRSWPRACRGSRTRRPRTRPARWRPARDRDTRPRLPAGRRPARIRQTAQPSSSATSSRTAPAQRHAGPAVAVAVHHVTDPLQPHLAAAPAAARPGGRAPPRRPAPAPAAAPAAGSRRPPRGTASGSTPPPRRCRRPRCRASAGRRTSAPRRAVPSSHQRSSPTCSTSTTWPCTGWTDGSAARNLAPIPEQLTTASGPPSPVPRQPVQVEPGDRAAGLQHARGQPVEVDRHLHDRAR